MDISSATNVQPRPIVTPNSTSENKIEGNSPDNDGDSDDVVVSSAATTPATNTTTDVLGTKINVTA